MKSPDSIAILGFGEAGTAIGRGMAHESGWRSNQNRLLAVDIGLDQGRRGAAMRKRADGFGIEIAAEYGPALSAADLVHSVVTCDRAGEAAEAAAPFLRQGALYLDHNTVTRKMAEDNARIVEAAGADYIDVAVMGGFLAYGYKAPMTIAGRRAEEVGAWLRSVGYDIKVMPGPAGVASAVKILRSILMKGIEALGVEFLTAARRQGLLEEALDCTADVDKAPFRDFVAMLVTTHIAHARRRHEECVLVNEMLRESGIEPLMSLATERSHFRSIATGAVRPEDPVPDLATALDILTRDAVRPREV
jgi:3-hydroxyisobutyrate dehydrogenase